MAKNGPKFSVNFDQKNSRSSKSVNSFSAGPIFLLSLGQDLSRNAFVASVYAFEKSLIEAKIFAWHRKIENLRFFFEFSQNESRRFDRVSRTVWECSRRVLGIVMQIFELEKRVRKSRFFDVRMTDFEEFQSDLK